MRRRSASRLAKVICKHFYIILNKAFEGIVRLTQIAHLGSNVCI